MYSISVFKREELSILRNEWLFLEKGSEMTYFQSYHWNYMLTQKTPADSKNCEAIYCLVKNQDGVPLLIAPLWIIKSTFRIFNKKGVYVIGRQGWSDYLNLIYQDFDSHAVSFLIRWLQDTYHVRQFFFEQLKETTSLYLYIKNHYIVNDSVATTCVHISLPVSIEDYQKTLSKSTRQNLRTAYNRLQKNGCFITFNFDDRPDLELCNQMRSLRVAKKEKRNYTFYGRLKRYIRQKCVLEFPSYLPFYEDSQSRFMTAYINGEFCAFFNYGLDEIHGEIIVMAVGVDEKYAKYSPGVLLLYEYIKNQIVRRDVENVDLTRGEEKYKYTLGGCDHFIHSVNFELK